MAGRKLLVKGNGIYAAAFFFACITAKKLLPVQNHVMKIKVIRSRNSFKFRDDESKPDSFENNWRNNSRDSFVLTGDDGEELFRCRCQSVANYCFGENATASTVAHGDTIAPGFFIMEAFVEPRNFHNEIHAITQTRDYDGEWIDRHAMQTTEGGFQNGRWLIHDRWSKKLGRDTNYAWSAGCIILKSFDLTEFNTILKSYGIRPGDKISGEVVEIN